MKTLVKDGVTYKGHKRYLDLVSKYGDKGLLSLEEASKRVLDLATAKFDETIEMHYNLNIKQKHSIRDVLILPHNFGEEKKVLVFAEGDFVKKAQDAGAAYVGSDDLIDKIKGGWLDFEAVIATPDMMKKVGVLGAILGRRKMMPNPKTGTVTTDIAKAVQEFKAGKVEVRADKTGNVHVAIAKKSSGAEFIYDNAKAIHQLILRNKPNDLKGEYINTLVLTPTMGTSIRVDSKKIS